MVCQPVSCVSRWLDRESPTRPGQKRRRNVERAVAFSPSSCKQTSQTSKPFNIHYSINKHYYASVIASPLRMRAPRAHCKSCSTTTTTTVLRPFFWDHPGKPVPEENFWTLRCKGRLTEADTPTIRRGATPSGLTTIPHFLQAGCLPAAQPTVSMQLEHSD